MKFVFVVGGSYKGFYLNYINKIKNMDLLIFNQGIFYEIDYYKRDSWIIIKNELINLNCKFNCPILVCGKIIKRKIKRKCFILCDKQKVKVVDYNSDIYLKINNKYVLIGSRVYQKSKAFATVSVVDYITDYKKYVTDKNNHFICQKKSVTFINKGKIYRKFQKCCKFILKKNK